jgi:hypothetical protein
MGQRVPPKKVWKQTELLLTHEPVENVIQEIKQHSHWSVEAIRNKLFESESLIRIPGARYHIYKDNLM